MRGAGRPWEELLVLPSQFTPRTSLLTPLCFSEPSAPCQPLCPDIPLSSCPKPPPQVPGSLSFHTLETHQRFRGLSSHPQNLTLHPGNFQKPLSCWEPSSPLSSR